MSRLRYARTRPFRSPLAHLLSAGEPIAPATGLTVRISAGNGIGPTRLAAFDHALRSSGVADFNLIRLSSVIPPGTTIIEASAEEQLQGEHGDALYCVYADAYASTPGEQAWAGVAWSLRDDGSGAGLFVEHHGSSRHSVERDLHATLEAMSLGRLHNYEQVGQVLSSAECIDHPVCAVVIATYCRSGWEGMPR